MPGCRLPTRAALERRFDTTPVTIQKVFDQLAGEGFVAAHGCHGTFVSKRPPHLCRYGLVFPYQDRPERPWSHFWTALAMEATALSTRNGHDMSFFYGNETHLDLDAYRQLERDVLAHRLAGLIFASKPFYLTGSPVLDAPGVPRVALMPEPDILGVAAVALQPVFFERAIEQLLSLGHRQIAVITVPAQWSAAMDSIQRHGLDVPPYWVQAMSPESPGAARSVVQLLMAGCPGRRPDGLIISDDNLVPLATAGLLEAGVAVPRDLRVVAHCNFPHPTPSAVPAARLGYDVAAILQACVGVLDRQRAGEQAAGRVDVPLVIEADGATESAPAPGGAA